MSSSNPESPEDITVKRKELEFFEQLCVDKLGPVPEALEEFWVSIELDGWTSHVKITKPKASTAATHPLIVLFHGGGSTRGTPTQITHAARQFALNLGAVVVCPTYKLLPESSWPSPMRSGWEVLVYLSKHAETEFGANLGGPGGGFIVGGVSSGGSVAAVAAGIFALELGATESVELLAHPLTGAIVHSAVLVTDSILPEAHRHMWTSREDHKNNPMFNTAQLEAVIQSLAADEHSPWFSPLYTLQNRGSRGPSRRFKFYFQACNHDPLRDDQVILHRVLIDHGFMSRIDIFPDDVHAAWIAVPFESKSQNPSIGEASIEGIKWLLEAE